MTRMSTLRTDASDTLIECLPSRSPVLFFPRNHMLTMSCSFAELEDCRAFEILRSYQDRGNYLQTKQARIIAMTCTHAALKVLCTLLSFFLSFCLFLDDSDSNNNYSVATLSISGSNSTTLSWKKVARFWKSKLSFPCCCRIRCVNLFLQLTDMAQKNILNCLAVPFRTWARIA